MARHRNIEPPGGVAIFVNFETSRAEDCSPGDLDYQTGILPGVSRTFALTIPVLPTHLARVVTNAYLLCRLADTIEDDVGLDDVEKSEFHRRFVEVVKGNEGAQAFAEDLTPRLSTRVLADERDLVRHAERVIRVTHGFRSEERAALTRCVSVMCSGMPAFQRNKSLTGLADLDELAAYCYFVAGVVGEMLTELFCLHVPELARERETMMRLAVSFGQGLQMTNILKDIWDDHDAGSCWLPRSVFGDSVRLDRLGECSGTPAFALGVDELVGIAHGHLRNALDYTARIPKRERGIRQFCYWAIGMAALTLRNIHRNPDFRSGDAVKISRRAVKATVLLTNAALASNRGVRGLFHVATLGLPLRPQDIGAAIEPWPLQQRRLDAERA
jgi:farnesyl-diphosphate farnesyltransferase